MIAWTGSGSATGYSVRYRMAGSSQWTTRQASGSPYTISGLMPETEYEVQVRSICGSSDLSGWSTSLFFFTVRGLACPMPMNLRIDNTTANTATVSWASSENASAYSVQWAVDAGTNPVWNSRNTSATTFTIDNLTPGTAYIIRVRSLCGSQFSDFTATVRTTTIAGRIGASSSDLSINYTVYPNPNRGRFTIQCEAQDLGNFQLKVVDLTGREVYSESFPFAVGANEYPVELPATVSAGVYFLHFTSGDVHQTLKIIVQ